MKSKEEVARLLSALAGAVTGVVVGIGLLLLLYNQVPWLSSAYGVAPLLIIIGLCGGGLLGGGYLGLWLQTRRQRTVRRKYFEEKKQRRKKGKK